MPDDRIDLGDAVRERLTARAAEAFTGRRLDEIVDAALEEHIARLAATEVLRVIEPLPVRLLPTMLKQPIRPAHGAISPELRALIAQPPVLCGRRPARGSSPAAGPSCA